MLILFGSIFAVILASSLLSREENEKTIEFVLARPVTRQRVLTAKIGVYVGYVMLFSLIVWLASYYGIVVFTDEVFDHAAFWKLALMTTLVLITFANLGFFASIFITRSRNALSAGLGIVLGMYAIQVVSDLDERFSFLRYVTPMKWASAADIFTSGLDGAYVIIVLVVNVVVLVATYLSYSKKDILP